MTRETTAFPDSPPPKRTAVILLDGLLAIENPDDLPHGVAFDGRPSLPDAFLEAVARRADHPAIEIGQAAFSYRAIASAAGRVATSLQCQQISSRGRVVLLLPNGAQYLAAFYGALLAGGVAVPLPPQVEATRLSHVLDVCEAEFVLTTSEVISRRGTELSSPQRIEEFLNGRHAADKGWRDFTGGMNEAQADLAMILFTAGSTGEPKGVMLSHNNLLANARSILEYLPITPEDRALALLPFYHAFGNSVLQTHVLGGATLVVDGSAAFPLTVTEALRRHSITSFSAVPEVYHGLITRGDLGRSPLPALRYMTVAGGALAPCDVLEVARRIAPARFFVMYGQTEATARLTYLPPEEVAKHPDSIGRAIPGVSLRVADESGEVLPAGQIGELQARGPNVMLGYWRDPASTKAMIQDGWLRTGDLAVADEEGLLYLRGRWNALVKVQGIRVHPAEIEEVVARRWPECRPVVVPFQGSEATRLAMFLQAGRDSTMDIQAVRSLCLRELPRPKVPAHIEIVSELPLNAALKIDRQALIRRAEAAAKDNAA